MDQISPAIKLKKKKSEIGIEMILADSRMEQWGNQHILEVLFFLSDGDGSLFIFVLLGEGFPSLSTARKLER